MAKRGESGSVRQDHVHCHFVRHILHDVISMHPEDSCCYDALDRRVMSRSH